MVARRYEFYVQVARTISSRHHVISSIHASLTLCKPMATLNPWIKVAKH